LHKLLQIDAHHVTSLESDDPPPGGQPAVGSHYSDAGLSGDW